MNQAADPRQNRLLAALPEVEWARWQPHLELVNLPLGKALYESGAKLNHVFFPTTAIVSLLYVMLIAKNGEVIGQSQMYVGGGVYVGINSVMENAQKADVVDADGGK